MNLEQTEVDDADEGTNGSRLEEVQVKESGKPALEPTQGQSSTYEPLMFNMSLDPGKSK